MRIARQETTQMEKSSLFTTVQPYIAFRNLVFSPSLFADKANRRSGGCIELVGTGKLLKPLALMFSPLTVDEEIGSWRGESSRRKCINHRYTSPDRLHRLTQPQHVAEDIFFFKLLVIYCWCFLLRERVFFVLDGFVDVHGIGVN